MADPAIIQIRDALAGILAAVPQCKVYVDRGEAEPISQDERPAIVVRVVEQRFDWMERGQGAQRHTAMIDLDFYEESLTWNGISARLAEMQAQAVALIAADRTLGGRCFDLNFESSTAELDATPDLGCATLTLTAEYLTPASDWTTLI
jgi:hypothetical protein